jgi:putative Mg2+ transporter-C (MgtC) family protein
VVTGLAIATLLLLLGRALERWLHRTLGGKDEPPQKSTSAASQDTPSP